MIQDKKTFDWILNNKYDSANLCLVGHYMGLEIRSFYGQGQSIFAWKNIVPDKEKLAKYAEEHGKTAWMKLSDEELKKNYGKIEWNNIEDGFNRLDYQYSWSSLMRVIDKIEKEENGRYGLWLDVHSAKIIDYKEPGEVSVFETIRQNDEKKIDLVYSTVVKFVRDYITKQEYDRVNSSGSKTTND